MRAHIYSGFLSGVFVALFGCGGSSPPPASPDMMETYRSGQPNTSEAQEEAPSVETGYLDETSDTAIESETEESGDEEANEPEYEERLGSEEEEEESEEDVQEENDEGYGSDPWS